MATPKKLLQYLDKNKIKYQVVKHKTVYTAYDVAQTLRLKLPQIAKTLLVQIDGGLGLAVLSASSRLDFNKLKVLAKAKKVALPKEGLMKKKLNIKPGAITPFGQLYKLPVYFEASLKRQKTILVGSGCFEESLKMSPAAVIKLEKPVVGSFAQKKK
ncbi:MAG: YbaK/EbsC family protein [Patescibacteria group bacterium]|nr:YbaK/EbsC family protein [Patescibacteria group bacterium]